MKSDYLAPKRSQAHKMKSDYLAPDEFNTFIISTEDGQKLELWRLKAPEENTEASPVVIIFHGNGDTLRSFYHVQHLFKNWGYTSYQFDYRGFGRSSGWPSEKGFLRDSEAVWNFVIKNEKLTPDKIILVGISLGTGMAAYTASKYGAKTLLMLAPYTSLPDVVSSGFFRWAVPFMRFNMPTKKFISKLERTCVATFHGMRDTLIPYTHSEVLKESYQGSGSFYVNLYSGYNHMTIFSAPVWQDIHKAMLACIAVPESNVRFN